MPFTFALIASWICAFSALSSGSAWPCCCDPYVSVSVHPRSAAASLAPLYTTLQKLPLSPWVISANL